MKKYQKMALIFPGQGAQYVGMAKDFAEHFPFVKHLFQEADDILNRKLSEIVWQGSEHTLTETRNSQVGIFVASLAILKVLLHNFPMLKHSFSAGLSLGEYSALVASDILSFQDTLKLVEKRGQWMNDACENSKGTMAVIMGLDGAQVEDLVKEAHLPNDLWTANFNCPGQVVISGTVKGIEEGSKRAKEKGAKRVLPLQVYGAFHSGLMQSAENQMVEELKSVIFKKSPVSLAMNVPGDIVQNPEEMRKALGKQITSPVRWEQCIRSFVREGADLFIEIGPGKTLTGLNKRIGVLAPTLSLEKIDELDLLAKQMELKQDV